MGGPVDFFRGLVGASPSQGSGRVKSKAKSGQYGHRSAQAVEGKPILKASREYITAQADKLEKEAKKFRTSQVREPKLAKVKELRNLAKQAKPNETLHSEKRLEDVKERRAQRHRERNPGVIDRAKNFAGKVVETVAHEVEELAHDFNEGVNWLDRKVRIADEQKVLKNLLKKREQTPWLKHPIDRFNLWLDIREQKAQIEKLEEQNRLS
ncbi:hypothetical protein [Endozoicomonas arenosclerae]|uniref:hypothetical protein n=1 Tax=Endozoicomonas arenosclerae TaxID=1633495 RepID=UPI00078334A0|nr:hypothetical protein [Endozoicomonas arenosclerae]